MSRSWRSGPESEGAEPSPEGADAAAGEEGDGAGRAGGSGEPDAGQIASELAQLRSAVRDLKHDIRMLKVGLDKQNRMLAEMYGDGEDGHVPPLRFGDRSSRGPRDVSGGHLSTG